ncbi:MAG: cytochrome c family protein [Desulfobacteraceae bacterium]|nr:cytochrome c family protein [Desulfobacteraceae bacterium]
MAEGKDAFPKNPLSWTRWLTVLALLTVAAMYLYFFFPARDIGPRQPVSFSHRVHAGVKQIECRFCHSYVERSMHAGLPEVEKCFFCHNHIIPTHPEILKEKQYLEGKRPVPWVRIFFVPDFVKFRHQPHIQWAKADCAKCHGDVRTMDRLINVNFQMKFCIDCHKQNNAQLDCYLGCHH